MVTSGISRQNIGFVWKQGDLTSFVRSWQHTHPSSPVSEEVPLFICMCNDDKVFRQKWFKPLVISTTIYEYSIGSKHFKIFID